MFECVITITTRITSYTTSSACSLLHIFNCNFACCSLFGVMHHTLLVWINWLFVCIWKRHMDTKFLYLGGLDRDMCSCKLKEFPKHLSQFRTKHHLFVGQYSTQCWVNLELAIHYYMFGFHINTIRELVYLDHDAKLLGNVHHSHLASFHYKKSWLFKPFNLIGSSYFN
jgi:hypothetical protein